VALIYKSELTVKQQAMASTAFECIETIITAGSEVIRLVVLYRPPSTGKSGVPTSVFLDEFCHYVDHHTLTSGKLLMVGDFNFHFDDTKCSETKKFKEVLESLNLEQHVLEPTHLRGHILDLVITRCDELPILNLQVQAPIISDHGAISFCLPLAKPPSKRITNIFRRINKINIDKFQQDIIESPLYTNPADNINDYAAQYNMILKNILDNHAPEQKKKITIRHRPPWFTEEVAELKRERRKAERKWRSSKLSIHRDIYKHAQDKVIKQCTSLKADYFNNKVNDNRGDQKTLFQVANSLLHRNKSKPLPMHTDTQILANDFADYFVGKIKKIRESFPAPDSESLSENVSVPLLETLEPTTCEEL
jgi:hypothetical protein